MKLTEKDKEFLEKLRLQIEARMLRVEFREDGLCRLILRKNYGEKVEREFGLTRQGVRWRFQRLLGDIYPSAYETLLFIESSLGTELRRQVMAIARQRAELRREALAQRGMNPVKRGNRCHDEHENRSESQ